MMTALKEWGDLASIPLDQTPRTATVLNKLGVEGAFEFKEDRSLNCFPAMSGDPLDGLDIHSLYKWIGDNKKYIALDKKAR